MIRSTLVLSFVLAFVASFSLDSFAQRRPLERSAKERRATRDRQQAEPRRARQTEARDASARRATSRRAQEETASEAGRENYVQSNRLVTERRNAQLARVAAEKAYNSSSQVAEALQKAIESSPENRQIFFAVAQFMALAKRPITELSETAFLEILKVAETSNLAETHVIFKELALELGKTARQLRTADALTKAEFNANQAFKTALERVLQDNGKKYEDFERECKKA